VHQQYPNNSVGDVAPLSSLFGVEDGKETYGHFFFSTAV
jgi:hypothetical protein